MSDIKKLQKFKPKKYSKGGYVKHPGRQYFDGGGTIVSGGTTGGPASNVNQPGGLISGISSGLGLQAAGTNITPGTNASQLNDAYTNAQSGLTQQQNLTNTLTPQAQTGVNTQNAIEQQELNIANGTGPNPAQNELAQATAANVANQASLAAGQRGSSSNIGLLERQNAQTGAATQQASAGQAATMEAQQQIAAQNNAATIAANQIGQTAGATTGLNTATQNEQNILQNANTSENNANVSAQASANSVNAASNSNVLGGIGNALSNVPVIGSLFDEGGVVGKDGKKMLHGHKKMEFVHKMTEMALKHYDEGGAVDEGNYTASEPSNGPSPVSAPNETPIMGKSGGNSGGGGASSLIGLAAAMAQGGPIQPNPLVSSTIQNPNMTQYSGQYAGSSAANAPGSVAAPNEKTLVNKKAKKSGPAMGTSSDSTDPNITGANNPLVQSGQATTMPVEAGGGDAPISDVANFMKAYKGGNVCAGPHKSHVANFMAQGGKAKAVPAMVSPQERYLNPREVEQVQHGANPMKLGYVFPGKDKVKGKNSLKNDVTPTSLEEGGVVIPVEVEKKKDPNKSALFVLKSMKATGKHMKKPTGVK